MSRSVAREDFRFSVNWDAGLKICLIIVCSKFDMLRYWQSDLKKNRANFYVTKDVPAECIDKSICYFNVGMGDNRCIVWEHPQKVSLMISVQKGVLSKIADNTLYILFKI